MAFNPSKCEVVRVTRKRKPTRATYTIHNHNLTQAKHGKYLGVTISENLGWNPHVDAISKKANNSLSFLRRNLAACPSDIKDKCYQTMVRPILEYASPSWAPHTARNKQQLEGVQRRAARFVFGDYRRTSSPTDMISQLGWESLEHRRTSAKLLMLYRIMLLSSLRI